MSTFPDMLYHMGGVPVGSLITEGKVYFVDPTNGLDANSGTKIGSAYATLQKAIDQCEADRGDVIIRLQGTETISTPILLNKAGITIMAATYGQNYLQPEKFSTYPSVADNGPTMILSQPCSLIGLEIVGRNTVSGTADTGLDSGAALCFIGEGGGYLGAFSLVKNCRFVDWWGNDYGIELTAGAYNLIEDCQFEGYAAGIYQRATASNNQQSNVIRNCNFDTCVNGIEHAAGSTPHDFVYKGNTFVNTSGFDIDTTGGLGDGILAGNYHFAAATAFSDQANEAALIAAGIACAGQNYSG